MQPRIIVEQKVTAFVNKYAVYAANTDGSKGDMIALAQQKRLAFKEKVEFWADEQKSQLAFTLRAEKVMDIHGKFLVEDPSGNLIGQFRKEFKQSLVISTWSILNPDDSVQLQLAESNATLAVIRRFGGFIPIVGDFVELFVLFFKYHFDLLDAQKAKVGKYEKTTLFFDHYKLSMTDDAYQQTDPRVLAAIAVALDALQSR